MKKIFTLLFALICAVGVANATKVFATFGAPASQGSWDAETQTYTWTAGWSNLMPIFTFANGELAEYTALHLTTSEYVDGPYRVCFMNGSTAEATIAFYSAGEKNLVFSERSETKDLDLSKITAIQFGGASGSGSVKLDPSSVYLVKPFALNFGEDGKAHITASDLDVTGNVTVDAQTGVITSTGTGTFSVSLPNSNFSAVTRIDVTRSGDDICNTMAINDAVNGNLNTWYGSKYGCDFTGYQSKAGQVNKITWNVNATGTMTISDIVITSNIINGFTSYKLPDGATDALSFNTEIGSWYGTKVSYPTTFAVQGNYWGNNGTSTTNRVDVSSADYLSFVVTQGSAQGLALRVWVTDGSNTATLYAYPAEEAASVANWGASYLIKEPGVYTVKISDWAYVSGIKADNNWNASPIVVALAYTSAGATPAICDMDDPVLSLSGSGVMTSSAKGILDNANATIIDATGVTGSGVELVSANPNCIFQANDGVLSNANNVMVGSTIANLVITDGKPMSIPAGATATSATYSRTASSNFGTICLPYAVSSDDNVQYYELESADNENVTIKTVDRVDAGTPAIFKKLTAEGTVDITGSGALAVEQNGSASTGTVLTLKGTYTKKTITNASELEKLYYISNNKVMQATSSLTVNPFRAYMEASEPSAAKFFGIFVDEDNATALDAIFGSDNSGVKVKAVYGVDGGQRAGIENGINIVKFTDGTTKTVIIK